MKRLLFTRTYAPPLFGKEKRKKSCSGMLWLRPRPSQVEVVTAAERFFGVRRLATSSSSLSHQQPRSIPEVLQWLHTSPSLQLDLTPSEMQKMVNRFPILRYSKSETVERTFRPTAEWLAHDFGLGLKGLKKCLITHPRVLYTNTNTLQLRMECLRKRLSPELTHEGLLKMVFRRPLVLSYTPNNINTKVDWLERRVGWNKKQMVAALQRAPQMLEFSIEDSLEPKLKWISDVYGPEQVGRVLMHAPQVLSFSMSLLEQKLRGFECMVPLLLVDKCIVKKWLRSSPRLILYNRDSIQLKLGFFVTEMGLSTTHLSNLDSRLLLSSLGKRIKPRVQELKRCGAQPSWEAHRHLVTMSSDEQFKNQMQKFCAK